MKRTLFLVAPSDDRSLNPVSREPVGDGRDRVEMALWGVLPILPYIESDDTLRTHSDLLLLGANRVELPDLRGGNLFNLVGDADASPRALGGIQAIANRIRPQRLFNAPGAVMNTARARVPKTLAGIPGCVVPRTEALQVADFDQLVAACDAFGCWPLILRAVGYHGARHILRLGDRAELESVREQAWLYGPICLVEYVDYRGADGLFQKNRVIFIDGRAYPRHAIFSDQWLVNAGRMAGQMRESAELREREQAFLAGGLARFGGIFEEIGRRVGLDVFGVDFAVKDGALVVFEANACMKFLDRPGSADARVAYLDDHVRVLKRALKRMLMQG